MELCLFDDDQTNDVADRVRVLGCDIGQGYGICRPLPFDQLTTWLVNTVDACEVRGNEGWVGLGHG